jgi:hypothetical protein
MPHQAENWGSLERKSSCYSRTETAAADQSGPDSSSGAHSGVLRQMPHQAENWGSLERKKRLLFWNGDRSGGPALSRHVQWRALRWAPSNVTPGRELGQSGTEKSGCYSGTEIAAVDQPSPGTSSGVHLDVLSGSWNNLERNFLSLCTSATKVFYLGKADWSTPF